MSALQERFKKLLEMEIMAEKMYFKMIEEDGDAETKDKLTFIRNQEREHIEAVKFIVDRGRAADGRKGKADIPEKTLAFLKRDFLFKKDLLDNINRLVNIRLQVSRFLFSLGRESVKFKKIERDRRELMGIVVHQLKTPLTVMKFTSEAFLEDGKMSKEQREAVEQIQKANTSMIALTNDLLYASKIEDGGKKLAKEKFNFKDLVGDVLRDLDFIMKRKGVKVRFNAVKETTINENKDAVGKIIFNLLTNAINYSKKGGEVLIEMREKDNNVLFSVSDRGIGIPEEEQKNIFQKFFRASNAKEFYYGGTGLGLYIVKNLVAKMKGRIWFASEAGKGTTFFVSLPA